MEQIPAQKNALRTTLRKQRRQLDRNWLMEQSAGVCALLTQLPELAAAQTVFCYVSCGGEVETHRLIRTLLEQGKRVAVPRCKDKGMMECVLIRSLEELIPGRMGIPEPGQEAPAISQKEIQFAVVPAVACGEDGTRLGQGGGYYDRFLEQVHCAFAAVCLEQFLLPTLPHETHDQSMKIIVTQRRVL